MKKETLVIRPEKHKRRIGVLPTYAQRDRTKYTRKVKHRGRETRTGERHGKNFADLFPSRFYAVKAGLAQTEEQTPRKRQVRSSILRSGTKI